MAAPKKTATPAPQVLQLARDALVRGIERDTPTGERSMAKAVAAFNSLTGLELTEEDGNRFMICLKLARSMTSQNVDNYVDICGYAVLAEESSNHAK